MNIFIYNKHKRPLKVSCEIYWVNLESLYHNRKPKYYLKDAKEKPGLTPGKQAKINFAKDTVEGELSLLDLQNGLKSSLRKGKGKNLFDFQSKL